MQIEHGNDKIYPPTAGRIPMRQRYKHKTTFMLNIDVL